MMKVLFGVEEAIIGMVHLLQVADGAIVGTWLREDGVVANPVGEERVRRLVSDGEQIASIYEVGLPPARIIWEQCN